MFLKPILGVAYRDRRVEHGTVCPGSSDPPEKILNIFASENKVYTIF